MVSKHEIELFVLDINEYFIKLILGIEEEYGYDQFWSKYDTFSAIINNGNILSITYLGGNINKGKFNSLLQEVNSNLKIDEELCHMQNF